MKHKREPFRLLPYPIGLFATLFAPSASYVCPLTDVRDSNRTNITALFLCVIVPTDGFEPSTLGLKALCSTTELRKHKGMIGVAPMPSWLQTKCSTSELHSLAYDKSNLWCKRDSNSPNPQWE